jgi:DNA (cytosine-5)-methyltransferase 1
VLKAVDLFAGAGGFSLAAILAGFKLEFAVENDKHAVVTYKNNICDKYSLENTTIYSENIEALSPKELNAEHFPNKSRCDLLLGGPPCQGFSTHRICDSGVDDPRNNLIHTYFKFVKTVKPRVFLMENVPGILWERHKDYLEQFYLEGAKAGYELFKPVVIDARDFGIPQRRKRVFILGLEKNIVPTNFDWPPSPTHADSKILNTSPGLLPWVSCENVFSEAVVNDINNLHMNHGQELIEAFKNTPINGGSRKDSGRVLPCHKKHNGHKDVYGRIDPYLPAPTMTTACINPSKGRFVHPVEHHGITARQAARIQTFPDDFVFYGGLTAAGKQIGNAVPVQLGKVIIEHITTLLIPTSTNTNNIANEMEEFA